MRDPFPLQRPEYLVKYVQPVADALHLRTLPLHFHEVAFAFALYHITNKYISPAFSRYFFPNIYPQFNARTKLNWDVHIVSFVQSTVICGLALWVMLADDEREQMSQAERVHGYTGGTGLVQAFAGGYFLWDLVITVQNVSVFGIGMLFHAISALCVFSLGFRPFVNFYAPTFILYELSSPFLNIHWFCDKLSLTGSTLQLINGIFLLLTFMSCRLFWGTYQSIRVFGDVWAAYKAGPVTFLDPSIKSFDNATAIDAGTTERTAVMGFADGHTVPLWIASAYLASNLILNGLNWFWFTKMIETLRKRFDPPLGTRRAEKPSHIEIPENEKVLIEGIHVATPGIGADGKVLVPEHFGINGDGEVVKVEAKTTHLEVESREVRSRTSTRRRG
ncbi:hypothetical protein E8E13_010046 [Curvularia kusanoi]|uniref:TLC domain-containing protein n=1 Tax=Curvularia kusanoi TaxID=90978 RepID=A0A9P4TIH3_CURKU|nr:hypothetical protein E8E13_010046 [Curvularia kusanoi]